MVVAIDGLHIHLPDRDRVITPAVLRGGYENRCISLMCAWIEPGQKMLDIGAHVGLFSLYAAREVGPTGRVVAFEPNPDNYVLLNRNVEANGFANISPLPLAAAMEAGSATLYCSPDNTGAHSIVQHEGWEIVTVGVIPPDAVTDPPVSFIKTDCQGYDLQALYGTSYIIEHSPNLAMAVEFSPRLLKGAGNSGSEMLGFLHDMGFELWYTHTPRLKPVNDAELLSMHPESSTRHTNLWCVKCETS
jgi:FkbM family methyltransferase